MTERTERKERKEKMRAKFHLPRSSFLSENHESRKLTSGKDTGMRGKGLKQASEQDEGERKTKRDAAAVSG